MTVTVTVCHGTLHWREEQGRERDNNNNYYYNNYYYYYYYSCHENKRMSRRTTASHRQTHHLERLELHLKSLFTLALFYILLRAFYWGDISHPCSLATITWRSSLTAQADTCHRWKGREKRIEKESRKEATCSTWLIDFAFNYFSPSKRERANEWVKKCTVSSMTALIRVPSLKSNLSICLTAGVEWWLLVWRS